MGRFPERSGAIRVLSKPRPLLPKLVSKSLLTYSCLPTTAENLALPLHTWWERQEAGPNWWLNNCLKVLLSKRMNSAPISKPCFLTLRERQRPNFLSEHFTRTNKPPFTCTRSPYTPVSPNGRPRLWSASKSKGQRRALALPASLHKQSLPTSPSWATFSNLLTTQSMDPKTPWSFTPQILTLKACKSPLWKHTSQDAIRWRCYKADFVSVMVSTATFPVTCRRLQGEMSKGNYPQSSVLPNLTQNNIIWQR